MSKIETKETKKPSHLKDLALLFAVPIGVAVIAAAIVYTPRLLANPQTDFVYSVCEQYSCRNSYSVYGSGTVRENVRSSSSTDYDYYDGAATLRYYDVSTNSSRSLSIEEAQGYRLDSASKSPDGYTVKKEETSSGFLFWGDYNEGWYLEDGAKKKEIELTTGNPSSSGEIKFLGWVEN